MGFVRRDSGCFYSIIELQQLLSAHQQFSRDPILIRELNFLINFCLKHNLAKEFIDPFEFARQGFLSCKRFGRTSSLIASLNPYDLSVFAYVQDCVALNEGQVDLSLTLTAMFSRLCLTIDVRTNALNFRKHRLPKVILEEQGLSFYCHDKFVRATIKYCLAGMGFLTLNDRKNICAIPFYELKRFIRIALGQPDLNDEGIDELLLAMFDKQRTSKAQQALTSNYLKFNATYINDKRESFSLHFDETNADFTHYINRYTIKNPATNLRARLCYLFGVTLQEGLAVNVMRHDDEVILLIRHNINLDIITQLAELGMYVTYYRRPWVFKDDSYWQAIVMRREDFNIFNTIIKMSDNDFARALGEQVDVERIFIDEPNGDALKTPTPVERSSATNLTAWRRRSAFLTEEEQQSLMAKPKRGQC